MLKLVIGLSLVLLPGIAEARSTTTRGYVKSNGTYVMPSVRTTPNRTKFDNFSTRGNVNPYNGKAGTVDPYKPTAPKRSRF